MNSVSSTTTKTVKVAGMTLLLMGCVFTGKNADNHLIILLFSTCSSINEDQKSERKDILNLDSAKIDSLSSQIHPMFPDYDLMEIDSNKVKLETEIPLEEYTVDEKISIEVNISGMGQDTSYTIEID